MNMFDFDGVVSIGLCPTASDVIVTGRGFDECEIVYNKLQELLGDKSNWPPIFFNMKLKGQGRTRKDSANHKIDILIRLIENGHQVETIFEDDPEQLEILGYWIAQYFSSPIKAERYKRPNLCFVRCSWIDK